MGVTETILQGFILASIIFDTAKLQQIFGICKFSSNFFLSVNLI